MKWLRWYHGSVTDPKFAIVAQRAKTTRANVISVWAYLLETASQANKRGDVTRCDAEDVAVTLDVKTPIVDAILDAMRSKKLIENGRLAGWDKRQPKREDNSRERTRLYRARKTPVTHCDAPVTRCDDRGEEKRGESSKGGVGEKRPTKRIRSLDALTIDEEVRAWSKAEAPDENADKELGAFTDWCRSKDKRFKDYRAGLRNWIRKAQGFINARKTKAGSCLMK